MFSYNLQRTNFKKLLKMIKSDTNKKKFFNIKSECEKCMTLFYKK